MNKLPNEIHELSDDELIKFNFNISNKFKNNIKIHSVSLPRIKKNESNCIHVLMEGTITKGFLDLFIRDSNNNDFWFPDNGIWDRTKDMGLLNINNKIYEGDWCFNVPDYSSDEFKIYLLVFEDSDGNTFDKRKVITGVEIL